MAVLDGIDLLLLEDEPLIGLDQEHDLRAAGARVYSANTCAGALKHLHERRVDFAVLDLIIGDGDCFEVAEECRALQIPYLITSGMAAREDILGCAGWIEKPFANATLIMIISQLLELDPD